MHGTEQRERKLRALRLSAPSATALTATGSTLSGTPQNYFRSGPVARNGLLLTREGCSLSKHPSRGQSSRPATSLPAARSRCPFGPKLHSLIRFASGSGCFTASIPLQRLRTILVAAVPDCLPSGTFTSLGIKNKTGWAATRSAIRIRPISLRSPLPLFPCSATDHRSRAATFSSACCSSNLLEPSSLCSRKR
jgi:hypothetical protein